jgi:hypothetical protein
MDIDNTDWESVLQFVADPLDIDYAEKTGVRTFLQSATLQVPTPPVSSFSYLSGRLVQRFLPPGIA